MGAPYAQIERIRQAVTNFWNARLTDKRTQEFRVEQLRRYVRREVGLVAPASPDRVLRYLRQHGVVNYRVLSRAGSLYEALPLA